MAKKRFISSILLCAFAVIFAHSIIPHHHHEEEITAQHQGSHNDDHEDIDHNFLGEAFSHFQHEQGSDIVYETASPVYQFKSQFRQRHILFGSVHCSGTSQTAAKTS